MERERVALLGETTRIVQAAEIAGREVSAEEDARVLDLMTRVRSLEDRDIGRGATIKMTEPGKGATANEQNTLPRGVGISSTESG